MFQLSEDFQIYVVEDDEAVSRSLRALLGAHGFSTTLCESAEHFLLAFDPNLKSCLLLDLRLPGVSGLQLQAQLNEMKISIPIIIVTAHGDVSIAVQAMREGAIDFIEKPAEEARLLEAIELARATLFDGKIPNVTKKVVANRLSKLTEREREVLDHLLLGRLNKEIATALGVSQRTIEVHRARIREKMQARGVADLIRMIG